ncbi:S8 family serine peptidase [Bacillus sp. m3-13]|uniref:S8 family serine peptidase n=1 Tax=Bacillus sp. m3-13 TaxID=406124 RepID=UPI0001E89E68|nr:S8 family serine peptidase [Bacillus sp. m3-13]
MVTTIKKVTFVLLAILLLVSPFHSVLPANAVDKEFNAKNMLSSLTTEQRKALHQLETSEQTGLHLDPSVDLNGDDSLNVIVQFKELPAETAVNTSERTLDLANAKKNVEASHAQFKKDVAALQKKSKSKSDTLVIQHEYKHAFNGVSMKVTSDQVETLLESQAVKAIWSDKEIQVISPIEVEKNAEELITSSSSQTLHENGFTGEGVKVAVIDTGIDYNHPDLKDAYKGGYDFVDNDDDPMETTYEDWKQSGMVEVYAGNTYYTAHGTHVAGIIAGQGTNETEYAVTGISPGVDLYGYRVLGPYGSGMASHIIAAIDQSVQDEMDIINLSLGANINDPFYPTSIAVNNAVLAGVTTVVAAGNAGSEMRTLNSPGTSTLAITVGANNTSITVPTFNGTIAGSNASSLGLRLMATNIEKPVDLLEGETLSIVDGGIGQNIDYVGKNVEGKVVLISRGVTSFDQKIILAKNKGAKAILLYNNDENQGHIPHYLGETITFIPTFSLKKSEGEAVKDLLSNKELTITLNRAGEFTLEGGYLTNFSSRGPSRLNYEIKPEVTAPGEQILSTIPAYINGKNYLENYDLAYKRYSGTSMASPYVAGVAALLMEKNDQYTPEQIKTILMNSANPLNAQYSVFEAGSGQVDPLEALTTKVEIMVDNPAVSILDGEATEIRSKSGALNFGPLLLEGTNGSVSREVSIKNNDNRPKTFEMKAEFQVGIQGSKDAKANKVVLQHDKVVTTPGDKVKTTSLKMNVPANAEPGVYEGYVTLENKKYSNEKYRIPFALVVVEEGLHYMNTDPKAITRNFEFFYPFVPYTTGVSFRTKSVIKTLDFILLDGKTEEEIGFLGQLSTSGLLEETDYYVSNVFDGSYFPFTGNPEEPISSQRLYVNHGPGHYKVKMIATDKNGKTYTLTDHTFIDYTGPEFLTDIEEGVIEYEAGSTSYRLKGSLIDQTYESYKALGVEIDQSQNFIMEKYNSSSFTNGFYVNPDGSFEYHMPINPSLKNSKIDFQAYNSTGVGGDVKSFTLVEKGTPYMYGSLAEKQVRSGDTVVLTLNAKTMSDANAISTNFNYDHRYIEILDVKAHEELQALGETDITKSISTVNSTTSRLGVNVKLSEGSFSGDTAVAKLTIKVKDDNYALYTFFNNSQASYMDLEEQSINMISTIDHVRIKPSYSKISGSIAPPKALQQEGRPSWRPGLNASNIGAEVYVVDQEGNRHDAAINTSSQLYVEKLPLTLKEMQFIAKIPGHFTSYQEFRVGFPDDTGKVVGQWYSGISVGELTPGDVNEDGVIDIHDALLIEEQWGTNYRAADINFDQVVNATDLQFVLDNYLMVNASASETPVPAKEHNGRTIEDIYEELNSN